MFRKGRKPPKGRSLVGDLLSFRTTKYVSLSTANKDKLHINPSPNTFLVHGGLQKQNKNLPSTQREPSTGPLSEIIAFYDVKNH